MQGDSQQIPASPLTRKERMMLGIIGKLHWNWCENCVHIQPDASCQRFSDTECYIDTERGVVYCENYDEEIPSQEKDPTE